MRVKLAAATCVLFSVPWFCVAQAQQTQSPPPLPQASTAPQQTPPAVKIERLRVGGNVMSAKLVHSKKPKYPEIAKEAHVSGTLELDLIVATDGNVRDVHVISGPHLLTDSCVEAVKKWRYRPTTLNGQPVEVETEVKCVFDLNHK